MQYWRYSRPALPRLALQTPGCLGAASACARDFRVLLVRSLSFADSSERAGGAVQSGAEAELPGSIGNSALVRGGQPHPEPLLRAGSITECLVERPPKERGNIDLACLSGPGRRPRDPVGQHIDSRVGGSRSLEHARFGIDDPILRSPFVAEQFAFGDAVRSPRRRREYLRGEDGVGASNQFLARRPPTIGSTNTSG